MVIADLGCSSGPTALGAVSEIINMVNAKCRKMEGHPSSPKFMVFLNDLPGNDFNGVFGSLSNFQKKLTEEKGGESCSCFIAGLPGSFYGRLLPNKSLHFVHSSSSLHWLSQVPAGLDDKDNAKMLNKGKIYMSMTSPNEVINAYKLQFRKDFLLFLKCRAEEVISGRRMVLTFMGRRSNDPTSSEDNFYPWELIAKSFNSMVSEGLIEEDKLDCFNVPYYAPCLEEVKQLVKEESSFFGHRFEAVEVEWDGDVKLSNNQSDEHSLCKAALAKGERVAKIHRAVVESMLERYFGKIVMDDLFQRYTKILEDHFTNNPNNSTMISLVVSLIRN
uniref:Jasmonate O-methyltransferase n=2 Tax=Chenopodium quinoa TaxID=63459 RepID=A0A803MZZ7_CHEQI